MMVYVGNVEILYRPDEDLESSESDCYQSHSHQDAGTVIVHLVSAITTCRGIAPEYTALRDIPFYKKALTHRNQFCQ